MKHTDELTIQRLADGELSEERLHAARAHLIDCARCQSIHESLKAETELLRSALRGAHDEPIPDAIAPRADLSWILVAGIVLAVLGLSALWGRMPQTSVADAESTSLVTRMLIRGVLYRGWSTVVSTLFSLITLLVVLVAAAAAFRWALRRLRSTTAVLAFALAALGTGGAVGEAAVVERSEGEYILRANEHIANDLVVMAERARIDGVVDGDLIVLADSLEVSGTVRGDVLALADSIEVRGTVGGSVRSASRSLEIEGRVGRNILAASVRTHLAASGDVLGSFTGLSAEAIEIESPVGRDVTGAATLQRLNGRVGGAARFRGRALTIGSRAEVGGETRFRGQEEPEVHRDARLASPIDYEHRAARSFRFEHRVPPVTKFVFLWAAAFLFGAPLLLLAPDVATAVATVHLPATGRSLLVGLIALATLSSVAVVSMITLIGVPLSVLVLSVVGLGLYAAQTYVGAYVAREVLGPPRSTGERLGHLALGLLVLHGAASIPIVGAIVSPVVALLGFGGLASWATDRMTPPSAEPAVVPAATP